MSKCSRSPRLQPQHSCTGTQTSRPNTAALAHRHHAPTQLHWHTDITPGLVLHLYLMRTRSLIALVAL
jgi:hypothetical protein